MITKEQLRDFGFVDVVGEVESMLFPMEKILGENEEGKLALVITQMRNQSEFALMLPDGAAVYLGGCESLEELKIFEKCISEYEPNY